MSVIEKRLATRHGGWTVKLSAIELYAESHSRCEPELLRELRLETNETMERPEMLTGHLQGALLRQLVTLTGARRVLEIGTFTGYGALWMASALPDDGRLITCESDKKCAEVARRYFSRSADGGKIELRLGPAGDTLQDLEGPVDFVYIDADKPSYIAYWEAVVPMVRAGGVVAVDNVFWSGRVLAPDDDLSRSVAAFNEHAAVDKRMETVIIPIRDGLSVSLKR